LVVPPLGAEDRRVELCELQMPSAAQL